MNNKDLNNDKKRGSHTEATTKKPPFEGSKLGYYFNKYIYIVSIVIIIFLGINKFVFSGGAYGSSSGNNLSKIGLEYYLEQNNEVDGEDKVEAIVQNFGCHQEIYIYREDQLVMKLGYSRGKVYEIQ